ncbi:MAG: FMN-binding protein [Actinomycetota bacterium]
MGIKRPLMILGSTVGAVAAVLSYHPAASSTSSLLPPTPDAPADTALNQSDASTATTPTPAPTQSASPSATPSAAPSAEPSARAKTPANKKAPSKQSTGAGTSANSTTDTAQSATETSAPEATPTPTTAPNTSNTKVAKDQSVTGATAQTRWGPVQVQITVKDGKIIDAVGLQYPNGDRRSLWISEQAIPWLVEETLAEQIADVQIIGGATYTSMGWRQSLASAMQKAGL